MICLLTWIVCKGKVWDTTRNPRAGEVMASTLIFTFLGDVILAALTFFYLKEIIEYYDALPEELTFLLTPLVLTTCYFIVDYFYEKYN